jgi:zinc protease
MPQPIYKTILDNGLTVVLREMHHAPVTSFWLWYRVGSRHERPGFTGASHWVEHMMFKGSPRFPNGSLDRAVSREGGRWNAFTWLDFTAYYETMPADRIALALQLEADRMVNASFDLDDLETERTVILSERQMYENEPLFLLREELGAAAFRVHPYHHEIIGDEADLRSMSRDELYGHYRRYYAPQNATLVAVGDFQLDEMLDRIRAEFGSLPGGQPVPAAVRPEPPQRGERRVTVQGPGETAYLIYAYRSPAAAHDDYYPLALLNAAFSGGGSLGFIGGNGSNKSSRLYKALVATELAAAVSGSVAPTVDPYLYTITTVLRPGRQIAEVEAALQAEVARLAHTPINQSELDKALKRAKAQFVMAGESVTGQAQMIGLAESVIGDHSWFEAALERLSAVTLDDIDRVRQTYLTPTNRTVGIYEPDDQQTRTD